MLFSNPQKSPLSEKTSWVNDKVAVVAIVFLVFAVYLPVFFFVDSTRQKQIAGGISPDQALPVYGSDSAGFMLLANNLSATGRFAQLGDHKGAEVFRTPGYPAILAFWKTLFGSYRFFSLLQTLMVALTAFLLYRLGKSIFSPAVGFTASVFFMLNPNTIFHTMVILSEVSFVFFFVSAVYFLFSKNAPNSFAQVIVGLSLVMAVYIKPIAVFLPGLFALIYYWHLSRRAVPLKKILSGIAVIWLVFAVCLIPWLARNYARTGVPGLSSVSSLNLIFYNIPEFLSFRDGISPDQGRAIMSEKVPHIPPNEWAELKHSSALSKAALSVIKDDPIGYTKFHALKTIPFFLSSGFDNMFVTYNDVVGREVFLVSKANLTNMLARGDFRAILKELKLSWVTSLEQIIWVLLLGLSFLAICFDKRNRANAILLSLLILYFAVLTGPVAYARFRMPAEPFIFLLAVSGFLVSMEMIWRKKLALKR